MLWDINLKLGIHLVGSATHQVRVSSQSGHPDLLYSQEWVNVIFLHLWPQKLYRAFRFGTLWPISCSYPRYSQLTRHSLMLANGRIRQSLTALVKVYVCSCSVTDALHDNDNVIANENTFIAKATQTKSINHTSTRQIKIDNIHVL